MFILSIIALVISVVSLLALFIMALILTIDVVVSDSKKSFVSDKTGELLLYICLSLVILQPIFWSIFYCLSKKC